VYVVAEGGGERGVAVWRREGDSLKLVQWWDGSEADLQYPHALIVTDKRVYVACKGRQAREEVKLRPVGRIEVYDRGEDGKLTPAGAFEIDRPTGLAISPDGQRLYVTSSRANVVVLAIE
jgi:sugar lactone lactonase YvrE